MKIGVDVDGVLANFNAAFIDRVICVTGRDLFPLRPFDIPTWNYPEHYGYSAEETSATWENIKADADFWLSLGVYPENGDALVKLDDRRYFSGDEIYFITNRMGVRSKFQTEHWLDSYGFDGPPTVLISAAKGLAALALSLDVYLDDRWENAVDVVKVSPATKSFLMTRPWNINNDADQFGITRVTSVLDFLSRIGEHP